MYSTSGTPSEQIRFNVAESPELHAATVGLGAVARYRHLAGAGRAAFRWLSYTWVVEFDIFPLSGEMIAPPPVTKQFPQQGPSRPVSLLLNRVRLRPARSYIFTVWRLAAILPNELDGHVATPRMPAPVLA
jgi:hypothetical protein